jgi:hypothetical protein
LGLYFKFSFIQDSVLFRVWIMTSICSTCTSICAVNTQPVTACLNRTTLYKPNIKSPFRGSVNLTCINLTLVDYEHKNCICIVIMNWLLKFHISTTSTCHNHYNLVSSTLYSFTREGVSYPFSKPHLHPRFLCLLYMYFEMDRWPPMVPIWQIHIQ